MHAFQAEILDAEMCIPKRAARGQPTSGQLQGPSDYTVRHFPPLASTSLCDVPRRMPGILNSGESAQPEPLLKALAELTRSLEFDPTRADRDSHRNIAHPHSRHRPQVGCNKQTDLEPRIGWANADLPVVSEEPPGALRYRKIGKIELDRDAAGRKGVWLDGTAHVPHERPHVEFVVAELGTEPALTPFAQALDDRREISPGLRQVVFRSLGTSHALDDTDLLELLQPQAQQRA